MSTNKSTKKSRNKNVTTTRPPPTPTPTPTPTQLRTYTGHWRNGSPNGFGTGVYANGNVYVGAWNNGMRHGVGHLTYPDRTMSTPSATPSWANDILNITVPPRIQSNLIHDVLPATKHIEWETRSSAINKKLGSHSADIIRYLYWEDILEIQNNHLKIDLVFSVDSHRIVQKIHDRHQQKQYVPDIEGYAVDTNGERYIVCDSGQVSAIANGLHAVRNHV
jgi:hypothetical protein